MDPPFWEVFHTNRWPCLIASWPLHLAEVPCIYRARRRSFWFRDFAVPEFQLSTLQNSKGTKMDPTLLSPSVSRMASSSLLRLFKGLPLSSSTLISSTPSFSVLTPLDLTLRSLRRSTQRINQYGLQPIRRLLFSRLGEGRRLVR